MSSFRARLNGLDPLDMEVLERVLDATFATMHPGGHLDSDEELEAALRLELIDIARASGISDAVALKDILLATMPGIQGGHQSASEAEALQAPELLTEGDGD
jgi:hypothetical protein